MIRLLHLLDVAADAQAHAGARQLARDTDGIESRLLTIGRGGDEPSAIRSVFSLRRTLRSIDVVHAWGHQSMLSAALAGTATTRLVYSPDRFPSRRSIRIARAVAATRGVQVVASTDTMRRAFVTQGLSIQDCHLIRPAVDFSRIKPKRDMRLRAALGIRPDDYVLLACGASTPEANHYLAIWTVAILHVLNPRFRILFWGRGPLVAQHLRFADSMGQLPMMAVAERSLGRRVWFEELPAAADAALITATQPVPTLPICICMASGMPIVAVVSPTIAELLEDRHTALLVTRPEARPIAQRILDLPDDSQLRWAISDMARTEAYEFFSMTRFLEQYRSIYHQLISGGPVQVQQPAPGAGLRFHGRA